MATIVSALQTRLALIMYSRKYAAMFSGGMGSFVALSALILTVAVGACDGAKTTGSSCTVGSERCACYGNGTCNDGLTCRSNLCVNDNTSSAGSSGQDPTSGAGTNAIGQGGAGNFEGSGGSAIVAGQGGTIVVGAGGTSSGGTGVGGTSVIGAAGTGTGGVSVIAGQGGTTIVGAGGTSVIGMGGTEVGGTTMNAAGAGPNLIKNGDFSVDGAYWQVTSTTAVSLSTASIMDGAFCITASSSYTSQIIGWPVLSTDAANLIPGATYALSFRSRATYSAYLGVKVAAAVTPWLPTVTTIAASAVSTTWQQYRTTFVAQGTTSDPLTATTPIGLAFTVSSFTNGLVCLDDVVLAEVN
jgi:hypothetical protein